MHAPGAPFGPHELVEHSAFLRALARGLLGDEQRAEDLVQDTWIAALKSPPRDRNAIRTWLATIARRLAINMNRGDERRIAREESAARDEAQAPHDEALERVELARALFELVLALREPYRTAIYLRYYESLAPRTIASRLGVPVKTVKTRLSRALDELRRQLDERRLPDGSSGRDAWSAGLFAIGFPRGVASMGPLAFGSGLAGGLVVKKVVAAFVLLIVALFVWRATRSAGPASAHTVSVGGAPEAPAVGPDVAAAQATVLETPNAREPLPATDTVDIPTGGLIVRMRWKSDGKPAPRIGLDVSCANDPAPREERFHGASDGEGIARFDKLFAGEVTLLSDRGPRTKVEVVAGETREVDFDLPVGTDVEGVVIDPTETPVAGAEIWCQRRNEGKPSGHLVATTGGDGRFRVRGLTEQARVGARAAGHQPSVMWVHDELPVASDGARTVTLKLGARGGSVAGVVVDADGRSVAGARVQIGPRGNFSVDLPNGQRGLSPMPVPIETDREGRFTYSGDLQPGSQPVQVIARGWPVWCGEVSVGEAERAWLEVHLMRSARVKGRVLQSDGKPVEGMRVMAAREMGGGWYQDPFPPSADDTDVEGAFLLDWVSPGEQELNASAYGMARLGRAKAVVTCVEGQTSEIDLVLDLGLTIRGRVVDRDHRALAGWKVYGESQSMENVYPRQDVTDAEGRFLLANLGDCPWTVRVAGPGEIPIPPRAEMTQVAPKTADLEIVIADPRSAPAVVRGCLLDGEDKVPLDVKLVIGQVGSGTARFIEVDRSSGRFEHAATIPGPYSLRVMRGSKVLWMSSALELASGQTKDIGTIWLVAPGRIDVALHGVPIDQLERVELTLDRPQAGTEHVTFADGRFQSQALAPGTWILRTQKSPWFMRDQRVEVVAGQTTFVDVDVQPAMDAEITFSFAEPGTKWSLLEAEIRGEKDEVVRIGGPWRAEQFGGEPFYIGLTLPKGHFTVEAWTDSGLRGRGEIDRGELMSRRPSCKIVLR